MGINIKQLKQQKQGKNPELITTYLKIITKFEMSMKTKSITLFYLLDLMDSNPSRLLVKLNITNIPIIIFFIKIPNKTKNSPIKFIEPGKLILAKVNIKKKRKYWHKII